MRKRTRRKKKGGDGGMEEKGIRNGLERLEEGKEREEVTRRRAAKWDGRFSAEEQNSKNNCYTSCFMSSSEAFSSVMIIAEVVTAAVFVGTLT